MSNIPMRCDPRDIWEDSVPIGTFHIEPSRMQDRPAVTARILFVCPRSKRCGVFLGPQFDPKPSESEPNVWGWDGNAERPTLTPSINCIAEKDGKPTGGCGWHGFIRNGNLEGA